MIAVVDTSSLLRLFIPDGPIPDGLENFLKRTEHGDASLLAPELLLAEAGNVLLKKKKQGLLSAQELEDLLEEILHLPIRYFTHKTLIVQASKIAQKHKITVYDALFVSLAEMEGATLFTSDGPLHAVGKTLGLLP